MAEFSDPVLSGGFGDSSGRTIERGWQQCCCHPLSMCRGRVSGGLRGDPLVEIALHVVPTVVGRQIAFEADARLAFVEEELHEHVAAVGPAEENQLDIGGHGRHAPAAPCLVDLAVVALACVAPFDAHETHQRNDVHVVAVAQRCRERARCDRLVGFGDEIAQQGHGVAQCAVAEFGRGALFEVHLVVAHGVEGVELVGREEVVERAVEVVDILHHRGDAVEVVHEAELLLAVADERGVGHERADETRGVDFALAQFGDALFDLLDAGHVTHQFAELSHGGFGVDERNLDVVGLTAQRMGHDRAICSLLLSLRQLVHVHIGGRDEQCAGTHRFDIIRDGSDRHFSRRRRIKIETVSAGKQP